MTIKPATYVATIDPGLKDQLVRDLIEQDFEFTSPPPPHTLFSVKKNGISCTLYKSGKLTVQGKNKDDFIEFYLEPQITKQFTYTYGNTIIQSEPEKKSITEYEDTGSIDTSAHIGIDESGKGDFFGPLCVAGVFADRAGINKLIQMGVRDSKTLTPAAILRLARQIEQEFEHYIVKINPLKYNELIVQFANLNKLLAWGHATAIEHLAETTGCKRVIIDQFANESVVLTALKRKKLDLELTQRHRGEEDVVVAAASILARSAFVLSLEKLEKEFNQPFPKGASKQTIAAGREFVRTYGRNELGKVGKLHFKTLDSILGKKSE